MSTNDPLTPALQAAFHALPADGSPAPLAAVLDALREIEDALDLSVPALPLESLVSRVRRLADDRRRFYNDAKAERAEAERLRAVVDRLQPIATAAERFCRALDATKIGRLSTDACDELDVATRALRALFPASVGAP